MIRLTTFAAAAILAAAPLSAQEQLHETPVGSLIVQDESGGKNIPNFRYDAQHTAGGKGQITNETWRRVAPTIDIDLEKFPNAGSASEFDQDRVRWKLLATDGVWPWACCNAKLREHLSQQPHLLKAKLSKPKTVDPPIAKPESPHNWNVFAADSEDGGGQSFLITGRNE